MSTSTPTLEAGMAAAGELIEAAVPAAPVYYWGRFCRWGDEHGRRVLPASELTLLGFLGMHAGVWGWGSMSQAALAVRSAHTHLGLPDPYGPRVTAYLG